MSDLTLSNWVESYRRAWASNDPADIRALFTPDAEYFTAPYRPAWRGHDEIVDGWLGRRDEPGNWTFRYEITLASPDLNVVRGWTTYREPLRAYSNLWLIELADDGRCRRFTEWFMLEEEPTDAST